MTIKINIDRTFVLGLVSLVVLFSLVACGGGGGSGGGSGLQISASMVFPAEGMNFEDATITVHGVGADGADAVMVNGQPATSTDGFATWRATINLVAGDNPVVVEVMKDAAIVATSSRSITHYPEIGDFGTASDLVGSKLLIADALRPQVMLFDLQSGTRQPFAMPAVYDPGKLRRVVLDLGRNHGMVLAEDLYQIDLGSGIVTVIPVLGPYAHGGVDMCHDPVADRYLVLVPPGSQLNDQTNVVAYDPQTMNFSTYSGDPVHALQEDTLLVAIDRDPLSGRVFAFADGKTMFEIHGDGSRTIVGPAGTNQNLPGYARSIIQVLPGATRVLLDGDGYLDLVANDYVASTLGGASLLRGLDANGRFLVKSYRYGSVASHDLDTGSETSLLQLVPLGGVDSVWETGVFGPLAFDERRGRLFSLGSSGVVIDPASGVASTLHPSVQLGPQHFGALAYDAARDSFVLPWNSTTGFGYGFDLLAADGSVTTTLPAAGSSRFLAGLAANALGPGYIGLDTDGAEVRVVTLDQSGAETSTRTTPLAPAQLPLLAIHDPVRDLIYTTTTTYALQVNFDIMAVDPTTGSLSTLSMDGADGIYTTGMGLAMGRLPSTGEIVFSDRTRVIAVDPDTGGRRVVADFGARYGVMDSSTLCVDPRTGVIYLHVLNLTPLRGGLLVVDGLTGAMSFLLR
ncbi:MAG: hypothetical protein H6807_17505 [Planctomycetes bacterium]|nr:hypothetical protein [Planctomycetota bacterium]